MGALPGSIIGRTLGHYRILEQIGAGGMGVVYRARDQRLERDVALKVLPPGALADDSARKRFRKEALALSRLNHPNIATVFDFDSDQGTDFLVTELIPGVTLDDKLVTGALPFTEVVRIGIQIAAGLEAAHREGVVHRDLKPANLRLTPEGRLKILDFGLARILQGENTPTAVTESLTETQAVAGTLPYMAPEQLRGQPADARTDVWALGAVLYELAAGARPFQGQTGFELSSAILNQAPPPLPAQVPAALQAVVARCLEKEPSRRYQRAGEVRAVLEAIQSGAAPGAWRFRLARRRWLPLAGAAVALAAVLLAMNVAGLRARLLGAGAAAPLDSLAVLPFENLSGDPDQGYLAEGIHEALITDLAKLSGLHRVIARSSVMRFQKTDKPLTQIARELGVHALITGSVLRSGNRVRVTAHLINAATEEHLWSESYERELRDVLSLQNEIVSAITRKTSLQLTAQEQARLATARAVDPDAYEAYLKGRFYLNKFTPEGFQKGIAYLQQAVDKDPSNPLPYAGLALGYSLIGHEAMPDAFAKAKAAAASAAELGDTLAETEEAIAESKLYSAWDWEGARQGFQRALALNPSLPEAHAHYSWYLLLLGRNEDAYAEMKRAAEVDPLNPTWGAWLGWQYWVAGRQEDALASAHKSLELDPNFPWALYDLGNVYVEQRKFEEAIAVHKKAAAATPALRWAPGYSSAAAGRRQDALKIAAELKKSNRPIDAWGLAEIYAALGDKEEALKWLGTGIEVRFSWMPWMDMSPSFAPLRSDPRFQDLVRSMRLPR